MFDFLIIMLSSGLAYNAKETWVDALYCSQFTLSTQWIKPNTFNNCLHQCHAVHRAFYRSGQLSVRVWNFHISNWTERKADGEEHLNSVR